MPPVSTRAGGDARAWRSRHTSHAHRCAREHGRATGSVPVTVLPGEAGAVAELVAFLASPAGAYYAGCAFTLR